MRPQKITFGEMRREMGVRGAIQPKPTAPTSLREDRRKTKPGVRNFGFTSNCLDDEAAGDGIKLIVSQDRHVVIAVRRFVPSGDFVLSGSLLRHGLLPGEGAGRQHIGLTSTVMHSTLRLPNTDRAESE
jgi:hypothetical protein